MLSIFVASCGSSGSSTGTGTGTGSNLSLNSSSNFQLGQIAALKYNDPKLLAARDACAKVIFAKGIKINGKTITDRKVAIRRLIEYSMPTATGTVKVADGDGAAATKPAPKPGKAPFEDRLLKLENKTWDCVKEKGFVKKAS